MESENLNDPKVPAQDAPVVPPSSPNLTEATPATPESNPPANFNPSRKKLFLVVLAVIIVAVVLGGGYFLWQRSQNKTPQPTPTPTQEASATPDPTADWKTYTNTQYKYSIKYPGDWTAHSVEPGPGDVALSPTSRGFSVHPSLYKSTVDAKTYLQIETDGSDNLAVPTYEKYLEVVKKTYFSTSTITEQSFAGTQATVVEGSYDGYGFPASIKTIHFPSENKKTYFAITSLASTDSTFISEINQILSTFRFTDQDSNIKTYTSSNLAISFSYKEKYDDDTTISVKEIGNKVYVYPLTMEPEKGQYVQVFDKDSADTLKAAITKTIFKGYSTSDCIVNETTKNPSGSGAVMPASYKFAETDVPRTGNEDLGDLAQKAEKCPSPYVSFGGLSYFLMDQNNPSKFVFFSIGQYAINAGPNQTWQDTFKFTN